ncbi:MAG: tetratricopeptide repeat protein [Candidatus Babeliales bacterium]
MMQKKGAQRILCAMLVLMEGYSIAEQEMIQNYFLSHYDLFGGKTERAQQFYDTYLKDKGKLPAYLYKSYLEFLCIAEKYDRIIEIIPELDRYYEDDVEVQMIIAHILEQSKEKLHQDDAMRRYVQLNRSHPLHEKGALKAAIVYMNQKELHNALEVIEAVLRVSAAKRYKIVLLFMKAQIQIQRNNYSQALDIISSILEERPDFSQGWLVYGFLKEQQGRLQEAIKGYEHFLRLTNYKDKGLQLHFAKLLARGKNETTFNEKAGTLLDKAAHLFESYHYEQSLLCLNQYLEKQGADLEAWLLKAQLLFVMNRHDELCSCLQDAFQRDQGGIWYEILYSMCCLGFPANKALSILEEFGSKETSVEHNLYCMEYAFRTKAVKTMRTYFDSVKKQTSDPLLLAKAQFYIAAALYQNNEREELLLHMKSLEAEEGIFPPLDNIRAYYFATDGKDLEKAQHYVDCALKREHNNPYFLHTQAVIHYKKGDYHQAKTILEALRHDAPQDCAIAAQLGKTFLKLGDKERAQKEFTIAAYNASCEPEKQWCDQFIDGILKK